MTAGASLLSFLSFAPLFLLKQRQAQPEQSRLFSFSREGLLGEAASSQETSGSLFCHVISSLSPGLMF